MVTTTTMRGRCHTYVKLNRSMTDTTLMGVACLGHTCTKSSRSMTPTTITLEDGRGHTCTKSSRSMTVSVRYAL